MKPSKCSVFLLVFVRTAWLTNLSAIFVDFVSKGYELSDPVSGRFLIAKLERSAEPRNLK